MLLTSSQVSLAISSITVFIFTTVLFLCGYVVQQNTMNNIREAIKPRPLPDYSKLYNPPDPDASPYEITPQRDINQIVEVFHQEETLTQANKFEDEDGDRLVQGADGGFLRKPKGRRPTQKVLDEALGLVDSSQHSKGSYSHSEIVEPEIPADGVQEDLGEDSSERLSRAARRKRIKEEIAKINGPDPKPGANPYRRRRMW